MPCTKAICLFGLPDIERFCIGKLCLVAVGRTNPHDRARKPRLFRARRRAFSLAVTLDVPTPAPTSTDETLGIDLGIVHLAPIARVRHSAGKWLRRHANAIMPYVDACRSGGQRVRDAISRNFWQRSQVPQKSNHVIYKRIVQKAKVDNQAIAIEELRHIRHRTERTVRPSQRARQSSWAFGQLVISAYKAALARIPLHTVDPRNTSRTCGECGHCGKKNPRVKPTLFVKHRTYR